MQNNQNRKWNIVIIKKTLQALKKQKYVDLPKIENFEKRLAELENEMKGDNNA